MTDKAFVTDMNARERVKYADAFRRLEEQAGKVRTALEDENDVDLLMGVLLFGLTWHGVSGELHDILKGATSVTIPDGPPVVGQ